MRVISSKSKVKITLSYYRKTKFCSWDVSERLLVSGHHWHDRVPRRKLPVRDGLHYGKSTDLYVTSQCSHLHITLHAFGRGSKSMHVR